MQKFIGMSIAIAALTYTLNYDWKMCAAAMICGIGGVIYGDAI